MKRSAGSIAALLCIAMSLSTAYPQEPRRLFSVGILEGLGIPVKPKLFTEYWKVGPCLGGEFRFNLNEKTGIAVGYAYQPFDLNVNKFRAAVSSFFDPGMQELVDTDPDFVQMRKTYPDLTIDWSYRFSDFSIINHAFSLNLIRYLNNPASSLSFYLTAGVGLYARSMTDLIMTSTIYFDEPILGHDEVQTTEAVTIGRVRETDIGLNGGLGLEAGLGSRWRFFAEGKIHDVFTKGSRMDVGAVPEALEVWANEVNAKSKGTMEFVHLKTGLRFLF